MRLWQRTEERGLFVAGLTPHQLLWPLPPNPPLCSAYYFLLSPALLWGPFPAHDLSSKVALREHNGSARCSMSDKTYCQAPNFKPQYITVHTGKKKKKKSKCDCFTRT